MSDVLNKASLVLIPSGYKEDKIYSVIPTSGDGDLTFTRASDATRVNSAGLVERVPWNLVEQSNTFNVTWATSNASVTSGQSGYDGSTNAWLLSKSAANGFLYQTHTFVGVQTISIYAKAGTSNWVNINVGGSTYGGYFDLSNGVTGSSVGSPIATKITNVGGGWYRCEASGTYSGTTSFRIYVADSNGSTSGTSGNIYIQDAQLNEGSTAKPYFPTTDRLNVPRLDYSGGSCPSLLLEPQRTNLALYSEQFDNAAWVKSFSTITANSTTSPDGTQNADKIIASTDFDGHLVRQLATLSDNTNYSLSCFAKADGYNFLRLQPTTKDGVSNNTYFNLATGSVATTGSGHTASIESLGNGWYRCAIVYNSGAGASSTNQRIAVSEADNQQSFGGDGTSGIYIWGAQLEAGSYPTSYIPTTTSAATRVADAAYKTGISSLIGQTEGTLFVEADLSSDIDTANLRGLIELNDGTTDNRFSIYRGLNDLTLTAIVFNGGVSQANFTITSLSGNVKIALAYNSSGVTLYVNGSFVGTDTSVSLPACSDLDLGIITNRTDRILGDGINQALLFKTRLTNSELASLTGNQNYTINQAYASYGVASESPNCVQP